MENINQIESCAINLEKTGKRLKELREKHNYSIISLTNLLNLGSIQSVYQWEEGKTIPSLERIIMLSNLYKLNRFDELIVVDKWNK